MDFILSVYFGLNIKIEPSGLAKKKKHLLNYLNMLSAFIRFTFRFYNLSTMIT